MKSFLKFILALFIIFVAISIFNNFKEQKKSEVFYDATFQFDNNKNLSITYPGTYKKNEWPFEYGNAMKLELDSASCFLSDITLAEISFKQYNNKNYKYSNFGSPEDYKKYLEKLKESDETIEQGEQYFNGISFFKFTHKTSSGIRKQEFVRFYKNGNLVVDARAFGSYNNNDCLRSEYPAESDLRFILNNLDIKE